MIDKLRSRRSVLGLLTVTASSISLLSACGPSKAQITHATNKLAARLRHHGVAAHLGRIYVESQPRLKSLSIESLLEEITADIGTDIKQILDMQDDVVRQILEHKVRRDFSEENVVAVDGWLLSQTEAKVCCLVFRNREKNKT